MNKILRYSFVALMAMVMGNAYADDVTDVLTWETLGFDGSGNSYKEYSDIKLTSNAIYAAQASSGTAQYIQLRTNNNNSGIITTTSGGKLKSVTITFNAKTTDRAIEVYGKNEAYTAATDLYGDAKGTLLKSIAANDESKTLTVEGDYTFVGLKSASGAIYVDKIEITWEGTGTAGGSQTQGDITVGIARPTFTAADGTVTYDTWQYIESVDKFNKSADGLTVKFFQSPEIEATIVKDETQEGGYEVKSVCHQGEKNISLDYVWKLNCAEYDGTLKRHKNETLGSEKWAFGFDLTVAEGKSFTINAIDFDLLVEQNPIYRIRIMKGDTEVYNSTWITKTGGYNNEQWGAGSYCRITKEDVSFLFEKKDAEGNAINYQAIQYYPGFEEGVGTMTPLGSLTLEAGTYRVIAEVDFAKDSSKALSFDNFTLEGTIADGGSAPVEEGQKWDFTKWSDATVAALKAEAAASKTSGWSDVEKKADAEAGAEPTDISKDNCFWLQLETAPSDGALTANGVVIKELKGLLFTEDATVNSRNIAIAVNYPKTSLGDYAGGSYLWIGGKNRTFTIPAVAAGSTITIDMESHKPAEGRGVKLMQGGNQIGDVFEPTVKEAHSWTIENAGDVAVVNTNGCHIYTITVKAGATGISTVKAQNVQSNVIYNLAGQKVGKDYKGIVIMNGKKVVLK
ncbi:MAG: hypothetical protein IJ804_06060 [Prevotella sp.]|nr:hypothetical protein [Prevotella sp.]